MGLFQKLLDFLGLSGQKVHHLAGMHALKAAAAMDVG
jgi:hypothetical protein